MNETSPKSESEDSDYCCTFDCDFQGNFQEVKMHESECPKREGIIIQRWSDLIFAKWSKNDILLEEIKNEYRTEKALHETVNAATENLRKAVELKESRKMSPDAKANPLLQTNKRDQ